MKGLKPLNKLLSLQILSPMWIAQNVSRCEIPSIKRNCWLLSLCSCLECEVLLGSHLGRNVWEDRCSLKANPTELQGRTTPWFPDPERTTTLGAVFWWGWLPASGTGTGASSHASFAGRANEPCVWNNPFCQLLVGAESQLWSLGTMQCPE